MSIQLIILVILFTANYCLAQKNSYFGLGGAIGSTITKVSYDDYRYQNLKGRFSPTFQFGIHFRHDFKKRMSLLTGFYATAFQYRAFYPYHFRTSPRSNTTGFVQRIGFKEWSNRIGVPFEIIYRLPLKKNDDVVLTFKGGFAFDFSTGETGGEITNGSIRDHVIDTIGETTYASFIINGWPSIPILLGFGVEKVIGKRSLISVELICNIGTLLILNGEFLYYDKAVDLPHFTSPTLRPSGEPTESYRFYSRNSSVLLRVTYFFAFKSLRD